MAMTKVHAIFEKGVFRPTEPVKVAEGAEVDLSFEERTTSPPSESQANEYPRLEIRNGLPVIISPPGTPPITDEDVARALEDD